MGFDTQHLYTLVLANNQNLPYILPQLVQLLQRKLLKIVFMLPNVILILRLMQAMNPLPLVPWLQVQSG